MKKEEIVCGGEENQMNEIWGGWSNEQIDRWWMKGQDKQSESEKKENPIQRQQNEIQDERVDQLHDEELGENMKYKKS